MRTWPLWFATLVASVAPVRAAAAPSVKYLAIIRGIEEPKALKSGILAEAREALIAEVRKRPELSLDLPADLPTEHEALAVALRDRHLRAVEVLLTIVGVTRDLRPPAQGKSFRTMSRGIQLSITGTQLPDWLVALTGSGDAEVVAEVGPNANLDDEGHKLLVDAALSAIPVAMDKLVQKLRKGPPPPPKVAKKKH
jgi:hypothetical protein